MEMPVKPTPKIHLIQDQILAQLAAAAAPLTGHDLIQLIEPERDDDIYLALGTLKKAGQIEVAGTVKGSRNQPARLYRLAELDASPAPLAPAALERLLTVLEQEVALVDADGQSCVSAWSGTEQTAGDEFTTAEHVCGGQCAPLIAHPVGPHGDPIIQAIERLGEPRFLEGPMHADRLRALADCPPIANNGDIRAWLLDLAATLSELAA